MILSIDLGNTFTKVALFDQNQLIDTWHFPTSTWQESLTAVLEHLPPHTPLQVGWISVTHAENFSDLTAWRRFERGVEFRHIHTGIALPIVNQYASPETLGIDRVVAVIGARARVSTHPVLVLDAGTALTYDVASAKGEYLGGGISLGLRMRFQALHQFTARLPLVEADNNFPLVGNTTHTCIRSGVMNGILAEVKGIIERYKQEFGPQLFVFLTGGDMAFFENHLKSYNFADAFLIHRGINFILSS